MKFSSNRDPLLKEIATAQEVISSHNALSILSNILLEVQDGFLTVRSTDLQVALKTVLPVEQEQEGTATVFGDKLLGILRSMPPGNVRFSLEENMMLSIRPEKKKIDFSLRCMSPDKFPEQQQIPDDLFFHFPQSDMIDMISKTVFAVSSDETRYFLNGLFIERSGDTFHMVATDGKRLSVSTKPAGSGMPELSGVIVPPKIFQLLRKLSTGEGELSIALTDKNVFVRFGVYELFSTLIEGQFPKYQRVIPEQQDHSFVVDTGEFMEALRRVSLLTEQKSRKVFLHVSDETLRISSVGDEIGKAEEEIPCEYEGRQTTFAVNYTYLMDPLREMHHERTRVEFSGPDKALTVVSEPRGDFFHIVMPMQLS